LPLHPSPSPTLFPYTTLFRSAHARAVARGVAQVGGQRVQAGRGQPQAEAHAVGAEVLVQLLGVEGGQRAVHRGDVGEGTLDLDLNRKSTRLNSSHVKISYAVF